LRSSSYRISRSAQRFLTANESFFVEEDAELRVGSKEESEAGTQLNASIDIARILAGAVLEALRRLRDQRQRAQKAANMSRFERTSGVLPGSQASRLRSRQSATRLIHVEWQRICAPSLHSGYCFSR
jgi:hypothetical protein